MPYDTNVMSLITGIARCLVDRCSGDIPVVAAIVMDGKIVSLCTNDVEATGHQWRHAEFCAIEKLTTALGYKFLCNCDIYITLEPCPLCMAMIDAVRIGAVYFGAYNSRYGSLLCHNDSRRLDLVGGFFERENSEILGESFEAMRSRGC